MIATAPENQISPLNESEVDEVAIVPISEMSPAKSFMEELGGLDKQDNRIVNYNELEPVVGKSESVSNDPDIKSYMNIKTVTGFEAMLKRLIRKESMIGKKSSIQYMIDNPSGWNIEKMKEAFETLVLKSIS